MVFRYKVGLFFAILITVFVIGQFGTPFIRSFFIELIIWSLFASSFNILYGYTGMLSFGQSLFFGIGCYGFALPIIYWHFPIIWAIFFAIVISLLIAILTGLIVIKVSSHYFVIVSVLLSLVPFYLANHMSWLTGGDDGIPIKLPTSFFLNGLSPYNEIHMFWIVTIIISLVLFLCLKFLQSPIGLIFKAIKENELKAEFIGYNTRKYKLLAWLISGGLAGLSGSLYVLAFKYTSSAFFHWTLSGEAAVWTIFGGKGTFIGPIVGTFSFLLLKDRLSSSAEYYPILVSITLIALIHYKPVGFIGFLTPYLNRLLLPRCESKNLENDMYESIDHKKLVLQGNILEIEDLSISFDGINALNKISLNLSVKELRIKINTPLGRHWFVQKNNLNSLPCLIFIGPNGAGKTTLFNTLTGLHQNPTGKISIFDHKVLINTKSKSKLQFTNFEIAGFGLARTFQQAQIFADLTVEDNFRVAVQCHQSKPTTFFYRDKRPEDDRTIDNLITLTHLNEEKLKIAKELSYGRQKMLEIGMAIASGGEILLLDEPTAGVSPNEIYLIITLIKKLSLSHSILLIEHDFEAIKKIGFITCVLADGEIIAAGQAEQIMQLSHVKEKFYVS